MSNAIVEMIKAQPASDGAGVKLMRVFGGAGPERFDPFLMLDEFGSEEASDYIGGFPPHPHRGFETITYMLQGKMEHRDHMDHVGLLRDGDVQWMTAGKGIIHSEMPQQTQGKMRGFQLWLNLPASQKMTPAHYQDLPHEQLPRLEIQGLTVIGIAGEGKINQKSFKGYFERPHTEPVLWDIHIAPKAQAEVAFAEGNGSMVYAYQGNPRVGEVKIPSQHLARLKTRPSWVIDNPGDEEARLLFISGRPLKEPIVQYGPFVMNSHEQIEQAVLDYRNGTLA